MASVKKVRLTVEVTLTQVSPKDTITDNEIRRNIKGGMQQLFGSWGNTQNAGITLDEYQCEVITLQGGGEPA